MNHSCHSGFQKKKERALPQNRSPTELPEFGFHEVTDVPPGKLTLRDISHLLLRCKTEEVDLDHLAVEYKVDRDVLADVVHYFQLMDFKTPDQMKNHLSKEAALASLGSSIDAVEDERIEKLKDT